MIKYRKIAKNIEKWLDEKEIIILTGVRQVGKTSLLQLLKQELISRKVDEKNIFYLSLENFDVLKSLNDDPENIFKYVLDRNVKNYFLIDEIQYLDNPSNFLKLLYDKYADRIKLIVTGSSSLEMKASLQDSLAGRKVTFEIMPLDFEEFLQFKNFDKIDYLPIKDLPLDIKKEFDNELAEYLIYGGMPAVALQANPEKKIKLLEEYIGTYINKDVRAIGKIDSVANFNNLLKILASQIGNLMNVAELTNTLDMDRRNLEKYLDILEHTFVLYKVSPFVSNIRSQITKMPKVYFFDHGVRNAILNNFTDLDGRSDRGALFENFVYMELRKNISRQVYFYRTTAGSEIDLVFEQQNKTYPIEVKCKELRKRIDERVIENFMHKIESANEGVVINLSLNEDKGRIKYSDYRCIDRFVEPM